MQLYYTVIRTGSRAFNGGVGKVFHGIVKEYYPIGGEIRFEKCAWQKRIGYKAIEVQQVGRKVIQYGSCSAVAIRLDR